MKKLLALLVVAGLLGLTTGCPGAKTTKKVEDTKKAPDTKKTDTKKTEAKDTSVKLTAPAEPEALSTKDDKAEKTYKVAITKGKDAGPTKLSVTVTPDDKKVTAKVKPETVKEEKEAEVTVTAPKGADGEFKIKVTATPETGDPESKEFTVKASNK